MKIGIVCYPTYGGSGVVATELGKALAAKGHEVHFITYSVPVRLGNYTPNLYFHEVVVSDYPLFDYPPYELVLASKLVDVVRFEKLDLLHVHYAIPHASAAWTAQQILKAQGIDIPFVTTLHGTDITLLGKDKSFEPVISFVINNSNAVTAVSESLKQDTYANFNTKREITVIPNFIEPELYGTPDGTFKREMFAQNGEKLLIHISNFRPVKRVEDVVKIFHKVKLMVPAKLLLVGDGPDRHKIEAYCRENQTCDCVKFLGKMKVTEQVLSVGDVFILPSETESFGLAALEAMAAGLPVISSNTGGLPEINIHGFTGYLSKVGDVEDMANNTLKIFENQQLFKENCLKHSLKFSTATILPEYEKLYSRLLGTKRK